MKLQTLVNKYFYYLFIVTLIFAVILHDTIGFNSIDELCGLTLLLLFFYVMFRQADWPINKAFLITICIFAFYVCYSLWIGSNTKRAILNDLIIQMKPYLAFFCTYQMKPKFSDSQKKLLQDVMLVIWFGLFMLGMASFVNSDIIWDVMGHPSCYAASVASVSLVYLFCGNFTMRERIVFIIMLTIGIISGRAKYYGFFALSAFMVLYFSNVDNLKLTFKNVTAILILVVVMFFVAWDKIELYFVQGMMEDTEETDFLARFVLYATSLQIFIDYFPFGSGLASFATHSSGVWYSDIYQQYEIDTVWGLSKSFNKFIADTYYPSLAQFGIVGVLLYAVFWIYILRLATRIFKQSQNAKIITITVLIIGWILIENIADATFTSNRGFFMMIFLGLLCAQKTDEQIIQLNEVKENDTTQ